MSGAEGILDYLILGVVLAACVVYMTVKARKKFSGQGGCNCGDASGSCGAAGGPARPKDCG